MIRICHPPYQPSSISSSKIKLTAETFLKNPLSYSMLLPLTHTFLKTVPKINSLSTKLTLIPSLPHITKSPLNPVSFSKVVMLSSTTEKIKKSSDVIFTLKTLPLTLKPINQPKSKILKLDFHLPQLMDLSQFSHQPEDFLEECKRVKSIKKLQERKLQLIFWLLFQLLNKIKNNKRKLKTIQSFHQLLNHWTLIQLKFSMIYSDLSIKKNFWDCWSRSHWKIKQAKRL